MRKLKLLHVAVETDCVRNSRSNLKEGILHRTKKTISKQLRRFAFQGEASALRRASCDRRELSETKIARTRFKHLESTAERRQIRISESKWSIFDFSKEMLEKKCAHLSEYKIYFQS